MTTSGLVIKPLSPAESAKSRSLSGPARNAVSRSEAKTASEAENSDFKAESFVTQFMREQQQKQGAASPFNDPSKGRASPGSGMLSSDVMFALQEATQKVEATIRLSGSSSEANDFVTANGQAPSALSAYSRAKESVDRVRTINATFAAAQEASQSQMTAQQLGQQAGQSQSALTFTQKVTQAIPDQLSQALAGTPAPQLA
ncbi:hypothetical protein QGN29_00660 [Temperatibacter marinus]|uniref:Uncharacterized protein n=1 Tax=Temperatibacter marinus TaxID=1456591 RepID=A0AA52H9T5_9PROT|nr:hypothetical protein [Temperatibacter marinus]WND02872.1 hypothetical protein QGN29_00660 [Temperatibacter marinus]